MERLSELINNSEIWELLSKIGNERKMFVRTEPAAPTKSFCTWEGNQVQSVNGVKNPPSIYFKCLDDGKPKFDLELYSMPNAGFDTILYRSHLHTQNGTLVESNTDTVRGERLKKSLEGIVDFYRGGGC